MASDRTHGGTTMVKRGLSTQTCIAAAAISGPLLIGTLPTGPFQGLIEAFAANKPGIWGEPSWYVFLIVACIALMVALLVNTIRTAFGATSGRAYLLHALLLIGLALLGGLFYSSVTPPWQAPDEHAHYEYAALMGELNRVPTLSDVRQDIQAEVTASMFAFDFWRLIQRQPVERAPVGFYRAGDLTEYPPTHVINDRYIYYPQVDNEPPTYYALPALLYKLSARGDATYRLYVMRLASVLFWVGLSAAIWWASRTLFPDRPWLALTALTVAVLNPMLNHIGTVLSNDGLAALWSTLALGVLTLVFREGVTWRRMLGMLGLTLLAVFTKKSALMLAPTVALAFLLVPQVPYRLRIGVGLAVAVTALAAIALLLFPTGRLRFWEGGTRASDGSADNHVMVVASGDKASHRVGRQRTLPARGETLVAQARVRSEAPSEVELCLVAGSSPAQCHGVQVERSWQPVSVSFMVPEDAEQLELAFEGSASTRLWVDDVVLATATGDSLLRNGSMESGISWLEHALVAVGQPLGVASLVSDLFASSGPNVAEGWEILPQAWQVFFDSFWGNFGAAMVVPLKPPWPILTRVAVGLGVLGCIPAVARRAGRLRGWQKRTLGVLALALVLALAQTFVRLFVHSSGWMPQGRFVFPATWPIVTLLAIGWWGWTTRSGERWLLLGVTLPGLALYMAATWRLISYFHG